MRYIKLGKNGTWEARCLDEGTARFGTGSADPVRFGAALGGRFDDLKATFLADRKSPATATRFARDVLNFFSNEPTLWITFSHQHMWWGFFRDGPPTVHPDGDSTYREVVGGWRRTDLQDRPLKIEKLAGFLTKSAAYRGTTFKFDATTAAYVVRRINGEDSPTVAQAREAVNAMRNAAVALMHQLEPRDFELLVDLVFSGSGWRRVSELGRNQKTLDLIVVLPSTGAEAWIQVKSFTTPAVFAGSLAQVDLMGYDRMFFVYHSGSVGEVTHPRVTAIGPTHLAKLVVDGGLVGWLIDKVA